MMETVVLICQEGRHSQTPPLLTGIVILNDQQLISMSLRLREFMICLASILIKLLPFGRM